MVVPNPAAPYYKQARRQGDMGEDMKLHLYREDDGDIIVSVMPKDHVISRNSVQFCMPMSGGGQSPRTHAALCELLRAMAEDEKERPQQWREALSS